ncbi:hypothetical protein HY967_01475 [Candidatus Jorgensenbacteria bacterium]|nr:hypothetical protein [Candidatus Jorgensenbacteria bacterium]
MRHEAPETNMQKSNYEVEVLVNGKPLKEYMHQSKMYIEGREGTTFSLRLRNNSWKRKLFIPSIDGLSVMNGEECGFNSSGYIIKPYSSITIDGWRISDSDVAQFYFSAPNDSYRKRMEKGNNLGVIGVLVFEEKEKPQPIIIEKYIHDDCHKHHHDNWCSQCHRYHCPLCNSCHSWAHFSTTGGNYMSSSTTGGSLGGSLSLNASNTSENKVYSMQSMKTKDMSQELGTGWGEMKRSEVTSVEFNQVANPDAVFEIYYNTREQLERLGVDFRKESLYITPNAFPGQYCKPPQN